MSFPLSLRRVWSARTFVLCLALLIYCGGVLLRMPALRPGNNEAWFANPAVDLLVRHTMGTPVLRDTGTWLAGIGQHTYWTMPLYALAQVPWYLCLGFSLATQRLFSFFCGLVLLACVYLLVKKLSGKWPAVVSVLLIACDYEFVKQSSQGRMDMLCACLAFAGLALYVNLRERRFGTAVLLANAAMAASCMTHPYGMLGLTSLWAVMLYLDRSRIGWREIGLTAAPYAVTLGLWGIYILRAPGDFVIQMKGNTRGILADIGSRGRFGLLLHPRSALYEEMHLRYFDNYHSRVIPYVYVAGLVAVVLLAWKTRRRDYTVIAIIGWIYFLEMTLLEGLKRDFYLVHSVPVLAMAMAVVLCGARLPGRAGVAAATAAVMVLVGFQGVTQRRYARRSQGARDYYETLQFLEANYHDGQPLIAPAEFAYHYGFYHGLVDDWELGYRSGKKPRILVLGSLTEAWLKVHRNDSPRFAGFVDDRLNREYVEVMHNPNYAVYVRRDSVDSITSDPQDGSGESPDRLFWTLRPLP